MQNSMENNCSPKKYGWVKTLLVSILGTSIGVGLTFGVNRLVDYKKQQAAQRETAIMAVCDIDQISRDLKEELAEQDSLFKVTMYLFTHQERINTVGMDTINMIFNYLCENPLRVKMWKADTKENSFNSGMDARMNLGNNQFFDNVQSCYYLRRSLAKMMDEAPVFRQPISKEDYEEMMLNLNPEEIDYNGNPEPDASRAIVKQILKRKATLLYIKRVFSRRDSYKTAIVFLERMNKENKRLMNITEKDIEAYRKRNTEDNLEQANAELINGTWEVEFSDSNKRIYLFREDKTSEHTVKMETQAQILLPQEKTEVFVVTPLTFRLKGHWDLKGDTLFTEYDSKTAELLSFDMDVSNFPKSALERLKDSMEIKKERLKNFFMESIKQQTFKESFVITVDKGGNTMVWTWEVPTPAGNTQKNSIQVTRKLD